MKLIQVLGPGCPNCDRLAEMVKSTASRLDLNVRFENVTGIDEITAFDVMTTPALVVDGEVKVSGRVPSQAELEEMLR